MMVSWRTAAGMAALGLAALAGASGCGVAVASEAGLLATRTMTGGMCPDGACNEEFVVHDDGVWTWVDHGTGRSAAGRLRDWEVELLTEALESTRITDAPPFEDVCPIAYDGMEVAYGWAEDRVSNCDLRVDPEDPFVAILDDLAADARRG